MKEQILKIIEAVHQLYPYRVVGVRETYSHYNQGWQDACDAIEQGLSDFSPWVSVEDKLPDINKSVLLLYYKGKEGPFAIQGGLVDRALQAATENCPVDFWRKRGYGLCYVDYCDRDLQNLPAKKSKNQITHWMPLPENPKAK
jgi:hypothetical protein